MPRQSPNTIRTRSSLPPLPSRPYLANFVRLCDTWSDWAYVRPTRAELDEVLDETEAIKTDPVRLQAECAWWEQVRTSGLGALPPGALGTRSDSFTVVLLLVAWAELVRSEHRILDQYASPAARSASPAHRAYLCQRWLKRRAERQGRDPQGDVTLYLALKALGPSAGQETWRRATQHAGFFVCVLPLLPDTAHDEFTLTITHLVSAARRGASDAMRAMLDSEEVRDRARDAVLTILHRHLRETPDSRVTVAMALDGRFDGISDWVQTELRKQWARTGSDQAVHEVHLEDHPEPEDDETQSLDIVFSSLTDASNAPNPEKDAIFTDRLRRVPEMAETLRAIIDEPQRQRDTARRLGVTPKTFRSLIDATRSIPAR